MDRIKFTVNGQPHSVGSEVDSDHRLLDVIREDLELRGTKYMCKEGGCGACVVAVTAKDPYTGHLRTFSVNSEDANKISREGKLFTGGVDSSASFGQGDSQLFWRNYVETTCEIKSGVKCVLQNPRAAEDQITSCLISATQCQDWSITTVEGIGNRRVGYHPIQRTLAEYNGSQCGYCSVGWVMSMYSLLESNHYEVTEHQVEDAFGSNTCRCTGYRPILEAFKSFAKDCTNSKRVNLTDIEDLKICKNIGQKCDKTCKPPEDWCLLSSEDVVNKKVVRIMLKDKRIWYGVYEVHQIFDVLNKEGYDSYMLVVGNTSKGVSPILNLPRVLIDISGIWELKKYYYDVNLVVGASTTISDLMEIFLRASEKQDDFTYLKQLHDHLNLVAHIPVRNVGSIAGNLMTKHRVLTFSSDVFLLLETVGAILTIIDKANKSIEATPAEFLNLDMTGKLIINVKLPPLTENFHFESFKIMPRSQNAYAQVNAGLLYKFDKDHETVRNARIVFGGISAHFVHASQTEHYLVGQKVFTNEVLQKALQILDKEIIPEEIPGSLKPEFRKKLAIGLFYKGNLRMVTEDHLHPKYRSGRIDLRKTRPVSKSIQVFDTNPIIWPINEPIPKVEALIQCAGEAKYVDDMPKQSQEVFAAFVTSDICVGDIESIDPTPAMKIPGVLQFFSAKDIPGINSFLSQKVLSFFTPEEVLCSGQVKYYDQPIGITVAETDDLARRAALIVQVKYKKQKKHPLLSIEEAIRTEPDRVSLFLAVPARDRGTDVRKVFNASTNIYWQYHFPMETLQCITRPSDDGLDVFPSTQWPDAVHVGVADILNIKENRINLEVRRLGGAYGLKINRTCLVASACALVTYLMNRPCRFIFSIQESLRIVGKRLPCTQKYEVGVNDDGQIQYLEYQFFEDNGYVFSDQVILNAVGSIKNCYDQRRWQIKSFNVTTDTHSNTYARSPGILEAISMAEYLMERISYEIDKDPVEVRLNNLSQQDEPTIRELVSKLLKDSDYSKRKDEVDQYNKVNRWKKRGIRVAFMTFPTSIISDFHVLMSVHHGDGSVVICHGGVEMGQGVNTKVIQVVAYTLKISTDKIKIKANNVVNTPNDITTSDSRTSEIVCIGAVKCCQLLLDRLSPVQREINDKSWESVITAAYLRGINLQTSYQTNSNDLQNYRVYGVAISEVELDILTGEHEIRRVDLIEDVGTSMNPELDIGQIEGAFVMGIGYWTCEHIIYDEKNGEILTDRTWNYHVPLAKEIPLEFNVQLRRNAYNPLGILGSKAVAEPPMILSISVAFALRHAIAASREDSGIPRTQWFDIEGPYTLEQNLLAADVKFNEFLYQ